MGARERVSLFAAVGRIHIVAIATLGTFTFAWLFFGRYALIAPLASALDWFLVNLLNRVVDVPEDEKNGIVGTDFVSKNRRALTICGFALLAVSLVAFVPLAPRLLPFRMAFHALGLAYNWPLWPGRRRIKQLYFWKNTASAIGFILTVFCYPLAWGGFSGFALGIGWATIGVSAGFFFLFELSYEVLYDLRDREGDLAAGVRSYAVVHGERVAVRIADGLVAASMAVLVVGYARSLVPWRIAVMVVAPAVQLVVYKRVLSRRAISAADCIGLTWIGAGLLAAYHAWVLLGLPGVSDR